MINQLENLITEERNPRTYDLDVLSTIDLVTRIQAEDAQVAQSVAKALPQIAKAVDLIVAGLRQGGRLIYFGAGTSGRLGILDASECPPTFGVDKELVTGFIAGGQKAVFESIEGAEDNIDSGEQDALAAKLKQHDIACGITASGRTPYVIGALRKAKELGATTIGVTNNEPANAKDLANLCAVLISIVTGPEALSGSTRMKAGSAQKMVLNLLTTSSMIHLGKAYENLMVDLEPTNNKLKLRAAAMISFLCNLPQTEAQKALAAAQNNVKTAVLMIKKKIDLNQAKHLLAKHNDSLRSSLKD